MSRKLVIAQASELAPGNAMTCEVGNQSIALFNVGGTFFALENECSHAGGPLGEGELDKDVVTCPWHGACFSVVTGQALGPPAHYDVERYSVTVEGNDIVLELE